MLAGLFEALFHTLSAALTNVSNATVRATAFIARVTADTARLTAHLAREAAKTLHLVDEPLDVVDKHMRLQHAFVRLLESIAKNRSECTQELLNNGRLCSLYFDMVDLNKIESIVYPYICCINKVDILIYTFNYYRRHTDALCKILPSCVALKSLELMQLNDMDRVIKACPSTLTSLKITGGSVIDIAHLPPSLKTLHVRKLLVGNVGTICARCPDLEDLKLCFDAVETVELDATSCPQLKRLSLGGCRLAGTLQPLPTLTELNIVNCVFDSPRVFWKMLIATPNLERLIVEHTPIGRVRDEFPPNLKRLKIVNTVDLWNVTDFRELWPAWQRQMDSVRILVRLIPSSKKNLTDLEKISREDFTGDITTNGHLLDVELWRKVQSVE